MDQPLRRTKFVSFYYKLNRGAEGKIAGGILPPRVWGARALAPKDTKDRLKKFRILKSSKYYVAPRKTFLIGGNSRSNKFLLPIASPEKTVLIAAFLNPVRDLILKEFQENFKDIPRIPLDFNSN